jgi:hypothetical protein
MKRLLSLAAAGLMTGACVAAASGVAAASSAPAHSVPRHSSRMEFQPGGPLFRLPVKGSNSATISINWSGYAALSHVNKFNYVHATFVQPSIKCIGNPLTITSNWVGLDGYNDQTVEQDGTFAFCGGKAHTTPIYIAWYEMYPAGSVEVFKVNPGDIIDVSVTYANGTFSLAETDLTTGKTHTQTATCASCERDSAEWIIERPAYCDNSGCTKVILGALAPFGTTTMSGDTASLDGGQVQNVGKFNNYPIFMFQPLQRGLISLDEVTPLSGPSFQAIWNRSGTPYPITLGPRR